MSVGDVFYRRRIGDKYWVEFVEGEEFIEVRVLPVGGVSQSESESEFMKDIAALSLAQLVAVEVAGEDGAVVGLPVQVEEVDEGG